MAKKKIIIIGGGVSGLVAARELVPYFHVTIIEADRRLGGRIDTREDSNFSAPIEAGPEFVHGRLPNTLQLLKEAGIATVPVQGKMYHKEAGQWKQQSEPIKGWDMLMKTMKKVKTDMTLHQFLEKYYTGDENKLLRDQAIKYAEGFDLADIKKVSVQSLYREWSNEDSENFRIPQGYRALINFLEWECLQKDCDVIQGKAVKLVEWSTGSVTVHTSDRQQYQANIIIVSVPLSILQQKDTKVAIEFAPTINHYIKAASRIGMGSAIKILVQFKKRIWPADAGFIFTDELIPTWWTMLPENAAILTGWAGGSRINEMKLEDDESIKEKAFISLANIFDTSVTGIKEQVEAIEIFNWWKRECIGAAYSYSTVDSKEAKALLTQPISNTLYFIGEGLYDGDVPGTVEAAIVQAKETVSRLLN